MSGDGLCQGRVEACCMSVHTSQLHHRQRVWLPRLSGIAAPADSVRFQSYSIWLSKRHAVSQKQQKQRISEHVSLWKNSMWPSSLIRDGFNCPQNMREGCENICSLRLLLPERRWWCFAVSSSRYRNKAVTVLAKVTAAWVYVSSKEPTTHSFCNPTYYPASKQ